MFIFFMLLLPIRLTSNFLLYYGFILCVYEHLFIIILKLFYWTMVNLQCCISGIFMLFFFLNSVIHRNLQCFERRLQYSIFPKMLTTCLSSVHAMIYPSTLITDGLLNGLLSKFLDYLRYLFTFTHFQSVMLVPYCIIVASCYQLLCGNSISSSCSWIL